MIRKFYRVGNIETNQGLWYDMNGNFTGLIQGKFDFCSNSKLPMEYDEDIVGYLSATDTLDDLFKWFTEDDLIKLQTFGYYILVYLASDYDIFKNHWIICEKSSQLLFSITLDELKKSKQSHTNV